MTFAGKVALITGGAGGIGLALVKEFLKNKAKGVAIVDISEASGTNALAQIEEFGTHRSIFIKADITNEIEFEDAFKRTIEVYQQLDIVVNNAAILNEIDGWDRTLQVNLVATMRGSYLAMQKYLPKYKSGDEGIIANTASIVGLEVRPSLPAYSISKHGIVALGQALGSSNFYDKYKVRVVTVCPGHVDTELAVTARNNVLFRTSHDEHKGSLAKAKQTPEYLAENYIQVIQSGENGSVWVIEDNEPPYEVVIPDRRSLRKS